MNSEVPPDRSCISTSDPETFRRRTEVTRRGTGGGEGGRGQPEGAERGGMGRRSKRKGWKDGETCPPTVARSCFLLFLTSCIMEASSPALRLFFLFICFVSQRSPHILKILKNAGFVGNRGQLVTRSSFASKRSQNGWMQTTWK